MVCFEASALFSTGFNIILLDFGKSERFASIIIFDEVLRALRKLSYRAFIMSIFMSGIPFCLFTTQLMFF